RCRTRSGEWWRSCRSRTRTSGQREGQAKEKCGKKKSMENTLEAAIGLHHGADIRRAKCSRQTPHRCLTSRITIYTASVSYGGSPASACGVYVLRFSPYVFSSENP